MRSQKRKQQNRRPRNVKVSPRGRSRIKYVNWFPTVISFSRNLISLLPPSEETAVVSTLLKIADFLFDFIGTSVTVDAQKTEYYFTGAYSMFLISPAPMLVDSPLLAKDGSSYTYPGHALTVRRLNIKLQNTSVQSERSGQWAAVFVPFRESHDASHYTDALKNLSFSEVASMPHSVVGKANRDLTLNFVNNDKSFYCAQPRELTENIGIVLVIWDDHARSTAGYKLPFQNDAFNCEAQISGDMKPYVIFGPKHRVTLPASSFQLTSLTKGNKLKLHHPDGSVTFQNLHVANTSQDFEMI